MSNPAPDGFGSTVAAGIIGSDAAYRTLAQSIVEVARRIFAAEAASILIYDPDAHELVFEAAAGHDQEPLVGRRIAAGTGIMGWVLTSHEPMIIDDVTRDPRFDREGAKRLGYVPKHMMSAPLLHDDDALGVLNVLDRRERSFSSAEEMDLLGAFASQAAIAISVVRAGRRAKRMLEGGEGDGAVVARLAETIDALEGPRRAAATQLLEALDHLISD
jgi:GAF domain-containing protein